MQSFFDIGNNAFSSPLPTELGGMVKLANVFDVGNAGLPGTVPTEASY